MLRDPLGEAPRLGDLAGDAALRAVNDAEPREEQPQVVVDLRCRARGGHRRPVRELLLQGDRGRQALHAVHLRPRQRPHELPRVGRQAVQETALALRVEDVEGECRLAGAAHARHRDQAVLGDLDAHVLQVVLARAEDANATSGSAVRSPPPGRGRVPRRHVR